MSTDSIQQYRTLASHWHGGQWTALYAFASSGTVIPGLAAEVEYCLEAALCNPEIHCEEFNMLADFADLAEKAEQELP